MENDEQLYFGGDIYTVDDKCPSAEALSVKNGLIVRVGNTKDCRAALGNSPALIDLKGSALLPGFIDTHLHPTLMTIFELNCDLSRIQSIDELLITMKEKARKDKSSGWVMGLQFDEQTFESLKLPTRHDLDKACKNRPALILRKDGHSVIANTCAIKAAGITPDTPDPAGGIIEREPSGYPSGAFRETAVSLLLDAMPFPDIQAIVRAGTQVFQKIIQQGITSCGIILQTDEEGVAGPQGAFDIPLMELLADNIPIHLYSLLVSKDMASIASHGSSALYQPNASPSRRIGGMKFWADGTFSSRTAYISQPFCDFPDSKGFLIHSSEQMYARMVQAHTAGEQIAIHSIGDACSRVIVDLFDRLFKEYPDITHRHRLEHASLLNPDLIADIARLKLVVSTQPLFIKSEKNWLPKRLGKERTRWVYAFRSLIDAGIMVAGASDAPGEELNILEAIEYCVTRGGFEPGQGISVKQAIKLFTINAAYAQFEESEKGSLSVGKRADMVILSQNPVCVPSDKIKEIRVEQTICGGKPLLS